MADAIYACLLDALTLGVDFGRRQVESLQGTAKATAFGEVDWTLVNVEAREWARQYAGNLVRGIDETTLRALRAGVADFVDGKLTFEQLKAQLAATFGAERAERIATTEVTRAYAQGNVEAWSASGVIERMEWRTGFDERVCPQCGSLNGTTAAVRDGFDPGPPAHPKCRCWVVPVVSQSARQPAPVAVTQVAAGQPVGTPVSQALQLTEKGKHRAASERAIKAIDSVHGDGTLPQIPVVKSSSDRTHGTYQFYTSGRPVKITVSTKTTHHEMTLAHEVGHFLDHHGIGQAGRHATTARSAQLADWRKAVEDSRAYKTLIETQRKGGVVDYVDAAGQAQRMALPRNYVSYLARQDELWARSYAQYIATRSGDPLLREQLREILADRSDVAARQWADNDFAPIAAAFDALFKTLGWIV